MVKLFSWLLKRFITAFAILLAVQLAIYILGFNLILSAYESSMLRQYENIASQVLLEPSSVDANALPGNGPFFVFSSEKKLLFSNKGKGRSIAESELRPVYINEEVIGYFHAGELGFTDNQTNRVFLISVIVLSGLAVVLSLIIGFLSALYSSRRIARPIGLLRSDIHNIRLLKTGLVREFEILELTQMSQDVSNAGQTLQSQEEYKQQWLRDLAHDLRTPLSGLKAQLEAMADGVLEPSPERFRRHLQEIERLEKLAESIGVLTEVESRENIKRSEIDTDNFISQLISPVEIDLKKKGIKLEIDNSINSFFGDEQLLLRAIGNVLSNAVKYIGDGDQISLFLCNDSADEGPEGGFIIEIANNGPDIPEAQKELIFTRLFRGDSGRTSQGSGLGLPITREIIKLHGGEVRLEELTVEGVKTRGAKFVVRLP